MPHKKTRMAKVAGNRRKSFGDGRRSDRGITTYVKSKSPAPRNDCSHRSYLRGPSIMRRAHPRWPVAACLPILSRCWPGSCSCRPPRRSPIHPSRRRRIRAFGQVEERGPHGLRGALGGETGRHRHLQSDRQARPRLPHLQVHRESPAAGARDRSTRPLTSSTRPA